MNGKSILEDVSGKVKVVDSVKKEDQEKIEGNTGKITDSDADKKLEDAVKENKDAAKDNKDAVNKDAVKENKDLPK